jgi:prevent-host-death family protein
MNNRVGIRELRQQASRVLKRVAAGETFEVTDHGHPIARIVPFRAGPLEQLVLEGRATEATGDLLELALEMGLPAPPRGEVLPSQALSDLRADER